MIITKDIKYVGVNDYEIDLFEGQYKVPRGMAYNSYVILDEKIAVMDSVDIRFAKEWIEKIKSTLEGKAPDYLIVQHMEPDHSSSIMKFVRAFPDVTVVASARAFSMMKGFFGTDFADRCMVVGEGDEITLGRHNLSFITATMVHWPEVIMTYDSFDRVLFSADGFGRFGALDCDDDWVNDARRYYFGIVGKYGAQVQAVLKKIQRLDIQIICSLHGPVLQENLDYYFNLYDIWSSYRPEAQGICIAYTSVYGNTRRAIEMLADLLWKKQIKFVIHDLARCDMHKAVEDAFRYDRLILATTTYNGSVFPYMREFINHLTERNYQNRRVGFIENGSWSAVAIRVMKSMLEKSKGISYATNEVRITSNLDDNSRAQIVSLAEEFSKQF
ncbi:MAG: FprA family A-type flavoprotein [Clostridia bacterium]|nr:FprA family A-type flavoprotein [Clostridia bacterium]